MIPMFGMLVLELTSECNRACPWCMRQGDLGGRRFDNFGAPVSGKMPTEHVERMLREAAEMGFRSWVTFYLMSEPYLDDRLIEMATLARSLGMKPFINTNGDLLAKSDDLIKASREVFTFVQVSIYIKDEAKARARARWWREQLGPGAQFKMLKEMGPRPHVSRPGRIFPDEPCGRPAEKLVVQYDGSSPLCCYDINAEFSLPNAFDVSLRDLWYCEARDAAYTALKQPGGRNRFRICSTCPMPKVGYPDPFRDM